MAGYRLYIYLAFIIGAAVTATVIPLIVAFCRKYGYYDQPNQRKVHHAAVPRLGGLAFLPSMATGGAISLLAYYSQTLETPDFHLTAALMIIGATIIYLVGVFDDLLDLSAILKFVILAVGSAMLPACNLQIANLYGLFGVEVLPMWVAYPLTVLVIMTIVNAVNLIDGIDGLASGFALICLAVFTFFFCDLNSVTFMMLSAALLGSVAMFFCFNVLGRERGFKIFMGDAGSLTIGYVLSYLAIKMILVSERDLFFFGNPILIPYSLFVVPVFDLVRVFFTRLLSGTPVFAADKHHIHHVLMGCGLSMHKSLFTILLLVLLFLVVNIFMDRVDISLTYIFFADILFYATFFLAIRVVKLFRKRNRHLA
ncbi:MAG: undecaprenyl/decaprenyl-phosphate alpha-N-acetylglucosaminyl 1-phosphate transferase [Bacteroidaceae bacterium]|nr:undecaprenyl/decaprenyl-phosphate alpha-N-acetylglucosaminyl 1-phosphate transferase [Bacteroidaceae bacterium]